MPNEGSDSPKPNSSEAAQVPGTLFVDLKSAQGEWIRLPVSFETWNEAALYVLELQERGYFLAGLRHARVV
jgi:hypothetical protein